LRSSYETFYPIVAWLFLEGLELHPMQPLDILPGVCSVHRNRFATCTSQPLDKRQKHMQAKT
jgi:hypothetical protein